MTATLALVAALLPFAGGAARYVAFDLTANTPPILAWSLPFPELAAVGLSSLIGPALIALFTFWVVRGLPLYWARLRAFQFDGPAWLMWPLTAVVLLVSVAVIPLMVLMVLATPLVQVPSALIALLPTGWLLWIRVKAGALTFRRASLPLAVLVLLLGALWGLQFRASSPIDYAFVGDDPPSGLYMRVGEGDGWLYLMQCGDDHVIALPTSRVEVARLTRQPRDRLANPTVFAVMFRHAHVSLGLIPSC